MQTESSLRHSQVPTTCPYPEPDRFYRHLFNEYSLLFLRLNFKICTNSFKSRNSHTMHVCMYVCLCDRMYECVLWFLPKQLFSALSFNRIVFLKNISVFSARTKWNYVKLSFILAFTGLNYLKCDITTTTTPSPQSSSSSSSSWTCLGYRSWELFV